MKNHDFLVGMIILSISIVIFGVLLSQSIEELGYALKFMDMDLTISYAN